MVSSRGQRICSEHDLISAFQILLAMWLTHRPIFWSCVLVFKSTAMTPGPCQRCFIMISRQQYCQAGES